MKPNYPVILMVILLLTPLANAADLNDSPSSFDSHPECMERTTDSSTGNCIKQEKGTSRHRSQAGAKANVSTPALAPASAKPLSRHAAPRSGMGN